MSLNHHVKVRVLSTMWRVPTSAMADGHPSDDEIVPRLMTTRLQCFHMLDPLESLLLSCKSLSFCMRVCKLDFRNSEAECIWVPAILKGSGTLY